MSLMRAMVLVVALLLGGTGAARGQARLPLDWPAVARKVVGWLALLPGERVLLVAHPGMFEELVPHLRYEVMAAGGVDLGVVDVLAGPVPASWDPAVLRGGSGPARRAYREAFAAVDAAVMLPGAVPAHPAYAAMQDLLTDGSRRVVHFHWLENGSAFPIAGQPLPLPDRIDAVYQRALLETDYDALAATQRRFEDAMRDAEIRVTTPAGTDLRFQIGLRPVNRQDGDASSARAERAVVLIDREIELPAGAIRVAPLEETVNGAVAFPPSQWNGRPVSGLVLRFEEGRVTDMDADSGVEFAAAEMQAAGEAGRRFREFALGFNPLLAVPEEQPWVPYYGYGAGVVRLSLGDNSELGGRVTGGYVRWNFFADATVTVGNTVWVRDGKLVMD
ncbi:MAG: aminopeptidase [Gemmatimonadetes bacterium]|nr:aminopeptidase [Gemmatimonadota bacterium]